MEGPYLTSTVAKPLTQCLQELVEVKPQDPVEWIAHWLYKYTDNQLYLMEKAAFLEDLQAAQADLDVERERHRAARECLQSKIIVAAGVEDGDAGALDLFMKRMRGEQDHSDSLSSSQGGGHGHGHGGGRGSESMSSDAKRRHSGRTLGTSSLDSSTYREGGKKGVATWKLNCQWGLICQHPVLGDIEPRPPLVYPETPEWWERQGYVKETLYDHEVYSRENNDKYPGWDEMEHMTYKDFVQEGPWLSEGALKNMQPSLQDLYRMPRGFTKHKHVPQPGDREFPDRS